ncbi:MAG: hypothetical protein P9L99_03160 [Candidatus Lernaella stagnicola]|nr:hypothetical protein [Candidatus Lernaella stagnicola]
MNETTATPSTPAKRGLMKRLYDWVLHWAETPYAVPALFFLALAESSFFPIPPDALLIVMCLGLVHRSFRYAAWCSVGSIIGGVAGYYIGYFFLATVGVKIINFYHGWEIVLSLADKYSQYGVLFLGTAGFTPIPYKVFTIVTGAFDAIAVGKIQSAAIVANVSDVLRAAAETPAQLAAVELRVQAMSDQLTNMKAMGLGTFALVSAISRSARFFLVATLIYFFGERIKTFIEKYFNLLTIAFMVLLVLGFVLIKFVFGNHGG